MPTSQDRMLAFRSDLQRIADGSVVTGTQMMFAFQRFVAIVLDGEVVGLITPTATSSDDVPHDEPEPVGADGVDEEMTNEERAAMEQRQRDAESLPPTLVTPVEPVPDGLDPIAGDVADPLPPAESAA